jgi:Zn-dependent M28 family amino/carboxypeptidase
MKAPVRFGLAVALLLTQGLAASLPSLSGNLKAHVAFLAADELEGRATPSRGLDVAAAYIAAQFRGIGLEAPVDGSYFQVGPARTRDPEAGATSRNVIGLIRGTDPALRDTYVLVTAHYDHLGVRGSGEGARIYNGANDNASGVAGIIEIARALAQDPPRRSVAFIAFYGEETGFQGSRHYVRNPVFPLRDTVAVVNLEMIGIPDHPDGPLLNRVALTGHDYSEVGEIVASAARAEGGDAVVDPRFSEAFFARSDNFPFAQAGVPAHSVSATTHMPPTYHQPTDTWDTLDYDNMALATRLILAGTRALANRPDAPRWNESNPRAARFVEAWRNLQPREPSR